MKHTMKPALALAATALTWAAGLAPLATAAAADAPGVPGVPTLNAKDGSVLVTVVPASAGGPVDSYTVLAGTRGASTDSFTPLDGKTCTVAATANPPACEITGLQIPVPGVRDPQAYAFAVTATGPGGSSARGAPTSRTFALKAETINAPYLCDGAPGQPRSIPVTITGVSQYSRRGAQGVDLQVDPPLPAGAGRFVGHGNLWGAPDQQIEDKTRYSFAAQAVAMDSLDPNGIGWVANAMGGTTHYSDVWRFPQQYLTVTNDNAFKLYDAVWQFIPAAGSLYCADQRILAVSRGEATYRAPSLFLDDPRIVPAAPQLTAGENAATVTLRPPRFAAQVAQYTVTRQPGGQTCTIAGTASPLSCSFGNLVIGQPYTFTATATGPWGNQGTVEGFQLYNSAASQSDPKITEATLPSAASPATRLTLVPVNGACGGAHGAATSTAPDTGLCAAGGASAVSGSNGAWRWSCAGLNGGSAGSCSAAYASQTLTLSVSPGSVAAGNAATATAESTSGLKPVLGTRTSGICTVGTASNTATGVQAPVTGNSAGSCTVLANQPGTGDSGTARFLAASEASAPLKVNGPQSCKAYESRANVNIIDIRSSPGGQTVRGDATRFNVIYGSAFADTITGGNGGNCIDGGDGNDRLAAGAGENYLYGGDGNDTLTPGSGSTAMDGGAGNDRCGLASSRATATYANCEGN